MCKPTFIHFFIIIPQFCFCLIDGRLGKIDLSTVLSATYDSHIIARSNSQFNQVQSSTELDQPDDIILRFSPVANYSKEFSLLYFGASAGVEIAKFMFNDERSYTIPITSMTLDFDDTLSKSKNFSNNAKIRFYANFDVGQEVGSDLIEGDLISYTFFRTGVGVRYNHSPKFGLGSSTNYELREYQSGAINSYNDDLETFPITTSLFYIYSPKLDFSASHTLTKTKTSGSQNTLANYTSHTYSLGANGTLTQKLSGQVSVGFTSLDYDNNQLSNQTSITTATSLNLVHNEKTSSYLSLSRSFSPTASSLVQLRTYLAYNLSHRLNDRMTARLGIFYTHSDISQSSGQSFETSEKGFLAGVSSKINRIISSDFSYRFSKSKRYEDDFNHHILTASLSGRF